MVVNCFLGSLGVRDCTSMYNCAVCRARHYTMLYAADNFHTQPSSNYYSNRRRPRRNNSNLGNLVQIIVHQISNNLQIHNETQILEICLNCSRNIRYKFASRSFSYSSGQHIASWFQFSCKSAYDPREAV